MRILAFIYFVIIELRNFLYKIKFFKSYKFDVKIISVGNIAFGGTGKTPVVMKIAEDLLAKNKNVAVVTRGYKRKSKEQIIIYPNQPDFIVEEIGDEPFLIKTKLPKIWLGVGADRKKIIAELLKIAKLDYVILDDGYQKLEIKRDLNILLIDSTNPFPTLSREPFCNRNFRRADLVLLTKSNLVDEKTLLDIEAKISVPTKRIEYIPKNIAINEPEMSILTGIANPEAFTQSVQGLGVKIKNRYIFADHHWFTEEDLEKIDDEVLITTEKDFVKLEKLKNNKKIYVLEMVVDFKGVEIC